MKGKQVDWTCSRTGEKRQDIGWKDGKGHLEDLGVDGTIKLKLKK